MAIQILGDGNPDGSSMTSGASEKAGVYGNAVVQATVIATSASTLVSLRNKLNRVILALKNFGITAAS